MPTDVTDCPGERVRAPPVDLFNGESADMTDSGMTGVNMRP